MTRTLSAALITLGDPGRLTGGYLFHRRLTELAPAHDARLRFVSVEDAGFMGSLARGKSAMRRAEASGAEVLVLDSIAAAFVGPWLIAREPRLPMLGMLHQPPGGIDHGVLRTRAQALLDRLAYRRAQRLMLASESLALDFRRLGYPEGKLRVVPPGRDVAPAAGLPPEDPRRGRQAAVLCVGNWVERKGILSLLDSFARLEPDLATLHLVGDEQTEPGYAGRVRHRLAQADLSGRVITHGKKSIGEVAAFYTACDMFVLPSLKEPFGTVYGEAMALGLPVVGWRAGNLPFLADHEREGLLVEPGDIDGLASAMRRLALDPALRERLSAAGRERALSRPTWDEVAALFFGHVREVARAHVSKLA